MKIEEIFKKCWDRVEENQTPPKFLRNIVIIDADEFIGKIKNADGKYAAELVDSIYSGDAYILKNAISKDKSEEIKRRVLDWAEKEPENYQLMTEGCKNYHAANKSPQGPQGGYVSLEHSYVFFRHNKDSLGLFNFFEKYFEMVKILSGNKPDSFVSNSPKDGVIDRITFIQYPIGQGKITTHFDPARTQKLLVGSIFSQIGEDYGFGENGFYLVDKYQKNIYLENLVTQGDFICAYPTMHHGVPLVTGGPKENESVSKPTGRWYVQCYSPESHEVKNRLFAQAVNYH